MVLPRSLDSLLLAQLLAQLVAQLLQGCYWHSCRYN